jgi:collagen type I alpha
VRSQTGRRQSFSTAAFAAVLLFAPASTALIVPFAANAQTITKASASGTTLTIAGTSLGTGKPTVQLGLNGVLTTLTVQTYSATQVVATLPVGVAPATYELLFTRANGATAVFDLTIGAVGPTGPAGLNGINGVDGLPGATGAPGLQGIQGVPGNPGATGAQGLPGATGTAGPQGSTGATGPQGPAGAQGPPGTGLVSDVLQNTSAGSGALQGNTTGGANSSFGFQATAANSTGGANSSFGYQALTANSTGAHNTAIGSRALYSNSTGSSNTAVGDAALAGPASGNAIGQGNTAVGAGALQNTSGSGNIALGPLAGYYATTGNNNIFIGNAAAAADQGTIRIGDPTLHGSAFFAGIVGNNLSATGTPVVVDASGRLGTGALLAGPQGPAGPQGFPGINGVDGLPGATGAPGLQGLQGVPGNPGATGAQGLPGATGTAGPQGATGPQGPSGPSWKAYDGAGALLGDVVAILGPSYLMFVDTQGAISIAYSSTATGAASIVHVSPASGYNPSGYYYASIDCTGPAYQSWQQPDMFGGTVVYLGANPAIDVLFDAEQNPISGSFDWLQVGPKVLLAAASFLESGLPPTAWTCIPLGTTQNVDAVQVLSRTPSNYSFTRPGMLKAVRQ